MAGFPRQRLAHVSFPSGCKSAPAAWVVQRRGRWRPGRRIRRQSPRERPPSSCRGPSARRLSSPPGSGSRLQGWPLRPLVRQAESGQGAPDWLPAGPGHDSCPCPGRGRWHLAGPLQQIRLWRWLRRHCRPGSPSAPPGPSQRVAFPYHPLIPSLGHRGLGEFQKFTKRMQEGAPLILQLRWCH